MKLHSFKRDESVRVFGLPFWAIFWLAVLGQTIFAGGLIYIGLHFLAKFW